MIAMVLSCSPSMLIADEPTTALGVTVQAQILELFLNPLHPYTEALLSAVPEPDPDTKMDRILLQRGGRESCQSARWVSFSPSLQVVAAGGQEEDAGVGGSAIRALRDLPFRQAARPRGRGVEWPCRDASRSRSTGHWTDANRPEPLHSRLR